MSVQHQQQEKNWRSKNSLNAPGFWQSKAGYLLKSTDQVENGQKRPCGASVLWSAFCMRFPGAVLASNDIASSLQRLMRLAVWLSRLRAVKSPGIELISSSSPLFGRAQPRIVLFAVHSFKIGFGLSGVPRLTRFALDWPANVRLTAWQSGDHDVKVDCACPSILHVTHLFLRRPSTLRGRTASI